MTSKEFKNYKHIYFIGIGGISMSGLALVLLDKGYTVSGSDAKASAITDLLMDSGVSVIIGQTAANITGDIDAVVYTAAISADNEELLAAKNQGLPLIPRSKLLGLIMEQFKNSVAVAGTHGKTTTTSMISQILINADRDPTVSIGGIAPSFNGNTRIGASDFFVAEACEYTNSFLELYPMVGTVLNIELDHIDYFKNMDEIRKSFQGFIANINPEGAAVINDEIDNIEALAGGRTVITYGFSKTSDWYADNLSNTANTTDFDLYHKGALLGRASLYLPGKHNVSNALAACATCHFLGVPYDTIINAIKDFSGTQRRFELKGSHDGFTIFDDYAHHPSEIKATLGATRDRCESGSIWCVFQPHTFSRTKAFLTEFSESFDAADHVIITDIYAAREQDPGDISAKDLYEKMKARGADVSYIASFDEIQARLAAQCKPGDVVLTMGAGDIYLIGDQLLEKEDAPNEL